MKFVTFAATNLIPNRPVFSLFPDSEEGYPFFDGDDFLIPVHMKVEGASYEEDESLDDVYETQRLMEENKTTEICKIEGYFLLCDAMRKEGFEPYDVCDAYSSDLEFVYSTLKEYELDYDEDLDGVRNVFYIHSIDWKEEHDLDVKESVIKHLNGFLVALYHCYPDLTCFYMAPTERVEKERKLTLEREKILIDKLNALYEINEEKYGENVIRFGRQVEFTKEEINERLGRRNPGQPYPKELINLEEYVEFMELGFYEVDESRLLVKL